MKKFYLSVCVLFLAVIVSIIPIEGYAQDNNFIYSFESSFLGSKTGHLPYWFSTNVNGKIDPGSANFLNELAVYGELFESPDFTVSTGANAVFRLSERQSMHFSELYLSADYRAFRLDVGRFDNPIGLNNHALSAGSMMESTNAIPITRIALSTPDFVPVPFADGIVEYKGLFAHGWFTEDRHVNDAYLHQKYFYLKVNIGKFAGTGGIVHNAFWGGEHPGFGQLPQSFTDYLRVITASAADEDDNVPPGEVSNVIGNSLAAYDFEVRYDFRQFDLSLTRLFYLEDGVSRRFRSPWDGVWGANLSMKDNNRLISAVTYEHINTKQQDAKEGQEIGRANYYNHALYRDGWTNYDRVVGLPLLTYNTETDRIDNNIIVGHHVGIEGRLSQHIGYRLRATYSRNYGTGVGKAPRGTIDFEERRQDQYSIMLEGRYALPAVDRLSLKIAAALDVGEKYENSLGLMIGIRWDNALNF